MRAVAGPVVLGMIACCIIEVMTAAQPARAIDINDVLPCEPIDSKATALNYNNDFNDPTNVVKLHTVEVNHFNTDVQLLRKGETAPLPHDLDFLLRAFPNDYAGLNAMATWQLKNKKPIGPDSNYWSADCYFLRALSLWPNDWKIHYIYAIYLDKAKRLPEARREYDLAEADGASGADFYYNRGLFEIDAGRLDAAQRYANKAYAAGEPLPGLMLRLKRARREVARSGSKRLSANSDQVHSAGDP